MKKLIGTITMAVALCAIVVQAGAPQRAAQTLVTGGTTITNSGFATSKELKGLQVTDCVPQGGTNTFTLVAKHVYVTPINGVTTNTLTRTNTIGTVTTATSATGAGLVFTNVYVNYGEKVIVSGAGTNTGYAVPDWFVWP